MRKILNNVNRRFFKIKYFFVFFLPVCLAGCQTGHNDYYYRVKNSTDTTGAVLLTYKVKGDNETYSLKLEQNETVDIYIRRGVAGNDVWNIETSASIYVLTSMTASNDSVSRLTEDLSIRSIWPPAPENSGGNGIYTLLITDNLFLLEKQPNYQYLIQNKTDSTLFVSSSIGNINKYDTIPHSQTAKIGQAEIFSYNETLKGTDKYVEKKLSGISSLSLTYKEKPPVKVNLINSYKAGNIKIEKDECLLVVEPSIFE